VEPDGTGVVYRSESDGGKEKALKEWRKDLWQGETGEKLYRILLFNFPQLMWHQSILMFSETSEKCLVKAGGAQR
jgi:hypothetical protein